MASAGNGSSGHVSGELFKMMAGVNLVHVPYRGNGPALTDILGGQVQLLFPSAASAIEFVRAGTLRGLAVTTAKRSPAFPDIPALDETVPGYEALQWYGIVAPRNTPAQIVDRLNTEINAGLADQTMRTRLADLGGVPMAVTPGEFGKFIADETEKWAKVVKFSGARAD
jgi:tripartite-type tricarboxylate transporter receptor subunit TctC